MKQLEPNTEYESIAFSGCGLLIPYHLGVIKCFRDNNIKFKKASGVSAGNFAAGAVLELAHLELGIRQTYELMVQSTVGPFGNLLDNVEDYMNHYVKKDSWKDAKDRWHVVCATGIIPRTMVCSEFKNFKELSSCVVGGCWLPGIFGLKTRKYKDKIIYDHGLIDNAYPLKQSSVLVSLMTAKSVAITRLTDVLIEADRTVFPPLSWMFGDRKNPELFHRNVYVTGYKTCQSIISGIPKKTQEEVLAEYQTIMDNLNGWREMKWT